MGGTLSADGEPVIGNADVRSGNKGTGGDAGNVQKYGDRGDGNTNANAFVAVSEFPLKRSSSEVFVEDTVYHNPVVIFSKTTCGFCTKAKSVFDSLGVRYRTIEIDERPDCSQVQDYLKQTTGARSVPRVFIGGQCIGGGDDTLSMYRAGQLQRLLLEKNIHCPKCVD